MILTCLFFSIVNIVNCAKTHIDSASTVSTPSNHVGQWQNHAEKPEIRSETTPDNNLAILDYIDQFNNTEVQDKKLIEKYLEYQKHADEDSMGKIQNEMDNNGKDVSLASRVVSDPETQRQLKGEFLKHYHGKFYVYNP